MDNVLLGKLTDLALETSKSSDPDTRAASIVLHSLASMACVGVCGVMADYIQPLVAMHGEILELASGMNDDMEEFESRARTTPRSTRRFRR